MSIEVITTGERDVPTVSNTDITTEIQVLRDLIRITHGIVIKLTSCILTHRDSIADTERPRNTERHIAILVSLCHSFLPAGSMFSCLHLIIDIGLYTSVVLIIIITPTLLITFLLTDLLAP